MARGKAREGTCLNLDPHVKCKSCAVLENPSPLMSAPLPRRGPQAPNAPNSPESGGCSQGERLQVPNLPTRGFWSNRGKSTGGPPHVADPD